jgi:hypothetical protein
MQISETFVGFVSESRRNRISGALWGTREVGGVALGGWREWGWRGWGDGLGMAGGRDLARKVRESVSGLSKFTRPSTLTLLIRARSKKEKATTRPEGLSLGWSLLNAAFSNKIYDYNRPFRALRGTKSKISVYFFVTRITIRNFAPINI